MTNYHYIVSNLSQQRVAAADKSVAEVLNYERGSAAEHLRDDQRGLHWIRALAVARHVTGKPLGIHCGRARHEGALLLGHTRAGVPVWALPEESKP